MFTINVDGKSYEFENPVRLEKLSEKVPGEFYAATVNNRLRELSYEVDYDADVTFLDYTYYDTTKIYGTSMRYLVVMAVHRLYPHLQIKFTKSISMGIYGRAINGDITKSMLEKVVKEMKAIVDADYPIVRRKFSIKDAKEYYKEKGYDDKVATLDYRKEKVNIYEADGYLNYMYGYMVPSTGYLNEFELTYYAPGFLVRYPRIEEKGEIPEFTDSPSFLRVLNRAERWAENCNADMIYKMNRLIEHGKEVTFVNMCETKHNNQLCELGDIIQKDIDNIRLIAIAGPSSSGKTTFSKRLEIELLAREIKPLMISIDNYYLPIEKAPIDEFGEPDLEHLEALDLDLFNETITDLINGEEVRLPLFDFNDRERSWTEPIKLSKHAPIIIEGIHALNDALTEFIPADQKFKIYISPFTQVNIDYNNPINLTDIRLLRRIVRDLRFRNTTPAKTLAMWSSVRRGEYKWIFPFIESANYIFNSELTYELCVLKRYALDALKQIPNDSEYFIGANRLIKFLKYFNEIDDYLVPCNSLLREFIGKSVFK